MTTSQNVVLTSRGPITVRVEPEAYFHRGASALFDGDGTSMRPLHFVLLACHADMADEAPIVATQQSTRALAEKVLSVLRNNQGNVGNILRALNPAAAVTDRYYSIAVGCVTQRNVFVSAVGNVSITNIRAETRTSIITPNVVRIGEQAILNASFGIGFREEAVQAEQLELADDGIVVLIIGGDAAAIGSGLRDSEAIIEDVVSVARISPPIVAVVR